MQLRGCDQAVGTLKSKLVVVLLATGALATGLAIVFLAGPEVCPDKDWQQKLASELAMIDASRDWPVLYKPSASQPATASAPAPWRLAIQRIHPDWQVPGTIMGTFELEHISGSPDKGLRVEYMSGRDEPLTVFLIPSAGLKTDVTEIPGSKEYPGWRLFAQRRQNTIVAFETYETDLQALARLAKRFVPPRDNSNE